MKFSASLDVGVIAHETDDEVTVLLHVEAPDAAQTTVRAPAALQIVLDRSGSMTGPPLDGAKAALTALVERLDHRDVFGLVTFDDEAQVVVPAGPLTDKTDVLARIAAVTTGGMTDLSSGYLRGLRELRRATDAAAISGGTVLVVSDGHVNAGITDADEIASVAAKSGEQSVITSTLGYGHAYDETMLSAMAKAGNGNHVFAADPDAAGSAIAHEVEGLLSKVAQAVSVTVRYEPTVQTLDLYNDLPAHQIGNGTVMIELGDFYAQEKRKLLLRLGIDAIASLGLTQVAQLDLHYVEMPGLVEHTVSLPISVNVVPGDELGDRVPDPTVRTERLFQEAQAAKLKASLAFEAGDIDTGRGHLRTSHALLVDAADTAPDDLAARDIRGELDDIAPMAAPSGSFTAAFMAKSTRDSYHQQNRKRGRERPDAR